MSITQDYQITLRYPGGATKRWPLKDCYFDRRWAKIGREVAAEIRQTDREMAFSLDDDIAAEEAMEAEWFAPEIDLSKIPCQEANSMGIEIAGEPVPCGQPGAKVVFHQHDGRNVYVMCAACADHNIRNRRGIELVPSEVQS